MTRLTLLMAEFAFIFVGVPLLIYYRFLPNLPIAYLLTAASLAFLILRREASFPFAAFSSWGSAHSQLLPMAMRDAACIAALGCAVYFFAPHLLFSLVKRSPVLWALIMVLYPLVSVYPQEIVYRAFFFHRYQPLFGSGWTMLVASSLAFGFVHIIFGNWLAVALCVIGGLLFGWSYQHSGSLLFACLDHAIFGDFIFTIGLGQFFYHGSRL